MRLEKTSTARNNLEQTHISGTFFILLYKLPKKLMATYCVFFGKGTKRGKGGGSKESKRKGIIAVADLGGVGVGGRCFPL